MENILIAYNNDPNSELHLFFESCADDAKQFCVDNQHCFESVCPPGLLECNVTPNIHTFLYFSLQLMVTHMAFTMKMTMILCPRELIIMILRVKLSIQYLVCVRKSLCLS